MVMVVEFTYFGHCNYDTQLISIALECNHVSLCALDKVPLFDNRWSLNLFRLDGRHCLLMMWSQMGVHVVVIIVFVTNVRSAVDILICVVSVFHYTVRVIVLMIRLVIRTGNLLFSSIVLANRVRWPTGSGLPVSSKVNKYTVSNYFHLKTSPKKIIGIINEYWPQSAGANVRFLATVTGERSLVGMDALVQF